MKLKICLILIFFQNIHAINYIKQTFNVVLKKIDNVIEETLINTDCGKDLKFLMQDLIKRKKWAVQMIDACAKIEPGLLTGNIHQIGNYDECLSIEENTFNNTIKGQYCTLIISPLSETVPTEFKGIFDPLWIASFISSKAMHFLKKNMHFMKMSYGLCMPQSCSVENMSTIWNYIKNSLSPAIKIEFADILCDYKGKPLFHIGIESLIYLGFGIYFLVLIFATIYDIFYFDGNEESLQSYICTLSLRKNAKKLFSSDVGEDNISCINGLKVLSMLWVLIGHRFLINVLTPNMNSLYFFEWKDNIENMAVFGATVSVDTFLTISGLLVSYIYLRYTKLKNIEINMTSFYFLRICRLTPPLIAIILIYISVLKYVNDGPLWPVISGKLAIDCLYYGWTNLLYVNNFIALSSQCVPQSWYLSVDSQLYFLFPLIFFSILKNVKKTLYVMLFLGIISSLTSFLLTIQYEYTSILDNRYRNDIYQSTFLRMPVWLIGVATGYFVFYYKDKEFLLTKRSKIILWTLSLLVLHIVVFGQIFLVRSENVINIAIFNALGRPFWAISICWIIFACITKNGDIMNSFLSLPIFNFVAKITYSLYLVHLMVILVISGRRRHIDHFSNIRAIHEFCGDTIFSLIVGVFFSLLFESPVITFAKKFFRRYEEMLAEESKNPTTAVIKYKMWFIPVIVYTHTKTDTNTHINTHTKGD